MRTIVDLLLLGPPVSHLREPVEGAVRTSELVYSPHKYEIDRDLARKRWRTRIPLHSIRLLISFNSMINN
jgi:hypothetical protein